MKKETKIEEAPISAFRTSVFNLGLGDRYPLIVTPKITNQNATSNKFAVTSTQLDAKIESFFK